MTIAYGIIFPYPTLKRRSKFQRIKDSFLKLSIEKSNRWLNILFEAFLQRLVVRAQLEAYFYVFETRKVRDENSF